MIQGFDDETKPLSKHEKNILLPAIVRGLSTKIGKKNAITNRQIILALGKNKELYGIVNDARVRKIINRIRIDGLIINLIASSRGYYIENDIENRKKYVQGVKARAKSMLASLQNIEI